MADKLDDNVRISIATDGQSVRFLYRGLWVEIYGDVDDLCFEFGATPGTVPTKEIRFPYPDLEDRLEK